MFGNLKIQRRLLCHLTKKKKYIWSINAVNFITFARFFADTFERTTFDLCVHLIQNTCHSNQLNTYLVS